MSSVRQAERLPYNAWRVLGEIVGRAHRVPHLPHRLPRLVWQAGALALQRRRAQDYRFAVVDVLIEAYVKAAN